MKSTCIKVKVCGSYCQIESIESALSCSELENVLGKLKKDFYFYNFEGSWYDQVASGVVEYYRSDICEVGYIRVGQIMEISEFERIVRELRRAGKRFSDLRNLDLEVKSYVV